MGRLRKICFEICSVGGEGADNWLYQWMGWGRGLTLSRNFKEHSIQDLMLAHTRKNTDDIKFLSLTNSIIRERDASEQLTLRSYLQDEKADFHRCLFLLIVRLEHEPAFPEELITLSEKIINHAKTYLNFYVCEIVHIRIINLLQKKVRHFTKSDFQLVEECINMMITRYGPINVFIMDKLLALSAEVLAKIGA